MSAEPFARANAFDAVLGVCLTGCAIVLALHTLPHPIAGPALGGVVVFGLWIYARSR